MYFFDYVIGGSWWLMLLLFFQITAVFLVRGQPYTADTLVKEFFDDNDNQNQNDKSYLTIFFEAFLTFAWSIILPITLMVCYITSTKKKMDDNFSKNTLFHSFHKILIIRIKIPVGISRN